MDLYFFRHGPAGWPHDWHGDDSERPLTPEGRDLTERVARRLAELEVRVDDILTSPYTRAMQTAAIAAEVLGVSKEPIREQLLEPGFGPAALRALLDRHEDAGGLMLVGHEPDFSRTIGGLIGGARVELKKAGVALVELKDPSSLGGTLRWLLPPRVLAR